MGKELSVKNKIRKATKLADKHETEILRLKADAENNVPGATDKLFQALEAESQFYLKKEGKMFNDFLTTIEK